jgi:hypothetical protein
VKHVLKVRHNSRYVDDLVMFGGCGSDLNDKYELMCKFVSDKLLVEFHPNKKEINTVDKGVNFVGYIIKPYRKYLRKTTVNNLYSRVPERRTFKELQPTVNSYFGIMRQANCYNERKKAAEFISSKGFKFDNNLTKLIG